LKTIKKEALSLHIDPTFLTRGIHDGFSGGERKKIELLQALVLQPSFALFDEIDTGVDIDALHSIANGIKRLIDQGAGVVLITHNERILRYIPVDSVIVMKNGRIVKTGGQELIKEISLKGYKNIEQ
jgi:Fe-S cluster assembly ATP-binding protein